MGQHASTLKVQIKRLTGQAGVIFKNVQPPDLLRCSWLFPAFLPADLMGQHASTLKVQIKRATGQAGVIFKNVQQRALEKAKQARGPVADTTAGHGLHAE